MSNPIELWALGGAIAAAGLTALLQWRRRPSGASGSSRQAIAAGGASGSGATRWPEPTLPLHPFEELVALTGTAGLLARCRADAGLNAATWDELMVPVLRNVAELLQLLPASESHHHAQPGGLWIHTCETLAFAIRYRSAFVLPAGREADEVARTKHVWTAGVVIGALLHDVGKVATDVRVRLYGPTLATPLPWSAMAGSMRDAGATAYAVDFPAEHERDYRAHQRIGAMLLQRLVPSATLTWIGSDKALLKALVQYLQAEAAEDNPLARIVSRAEAQSVRANLFDGPRTRFATARVVPLIERLMAALRRMLAEGGHLPLNRPGAAGYVFEGDVWFAAARLANAVRDYLVQHESASGLPGEDKNDRLFDAWQDYGACHTNGTSGRALFGGRIEFDSGEGEGYDLPAMLRFPLDRLYPDPSHYPGSMPGRILPIPANFPRPAPGGAAKRPETGAVSVGEPASQPGPVGATPTGTLAAAVATNRAETPEPDLLTPTAATNGAATSTGPPAAAGFLDPADAATPAQLSPAPVKDLQVLAPVAPSVRLPTSQDSDKQAPERALSFVRWVQGGIADGSLPYNAPGAMVHFVRWNGSVALLLVSPVIFRSFEDASGDALATPGLATQRAFAAAGWHLRGPNGRNIFSYQILRSGNKGGKLLNGFLVQAPERFFSPVPPPNERLIAWNAAAALPKENAS